MKDVFASRLSGILLLLLAISSTVSGNCFCEPEDLTKDPGSTTLKLRAAAIFAILLAGTLGVLLPVLGKRIPALKPEADIFFMIKAFAAGVIIATAFIHILPDAFESLTSPCLKGAAWQNFPVAGFVAMMGALGTLMIDTAATGYYRRAHFDKESKKSNKVVVVGDEEMSGTKGVDEGAATTARLHVHTHASHGHSHGGVAEVDQGDKDAKLALIRHRVTSQVLELGIMVHSVIIGIALGTSESITTIKTLMLALCFHQFFEGMGLGGCLVQAMFKARATITMIAFFALTTPIGVAIGMGLSTVYKDNNPTSLVIQGLLNSAAAGILIYMALVDLLAADFASVRVQDSLSLQLGCNVSLLLGAGCMSVLAKWA